jgi:FkbM family methyltransferase
MPFISYAQNYEDVILWRALRDVEKGFYVDVGAADPEEWSVTRAFYDRGWSGINIEPLEEYFDKLTQARPRDINLKVAVGREAGIRTFHVIAGTGLSTFDPEVAARHQAAGWQAHDTVVPVLTLTKVLEDRGASTIHFLKIDVEGAEAEVLEGLNLDRVRPWIIVVEATEPFSTVSTRDKWEHLITDHKYSFAYFDGLNCFYVAGEVSELKERLAVPPNVFDEFVRFGDWSSGQKAARLERELTDLRGHTRALEEALRAEQTQTANLYNPLQTEQAQTAANQSKPLQEEQAHPSRLLARIQQLEAELAVRRHYRGVFGSLSEMGDGMTGDGLRGLAKRTRVLGDQITGGGLRSLMKRLSAILIRWAMCHTALLGIGRAVLKPFPKLAARLYELARPPDSGAIRPLLSAPNPPSGGELSSDSSAIQPDLPSSARPIYRRLQAAIFESNAWNQNR